MRVRRGERRVKEKKEPLPQGTTDLSISIASPSPARPDTRREDFALGSQGIGLSWSLQQLSVYIDMSLSSFLLPGTNKGKDKAIDQGLDDLFHSTASVSILSLSLKASSEQGAHSGPSSSPNYQCCPFRDCRSNCIIGEEAKGGRALREWGRETIEG